MVGNLLEELMSGNQWFSLGASALTIVAVLGGMLVGAYVARKGRKP